MRTPRINWTKLAIGLAPLAPTGCFFSPDGAIYAPDGGMLVPPEEQRFRSDSVSTGKARKNSATDPGRTTNRRPRRHSPLPHPLPVKFA